MISNASFTTSVNTNCDLLLLKNMSSYINISNKDNLNNSNTHVSNNFTNQQINNTELSTNIKSESLNNNEILKDYSTKCISNCLKNSQLNLSKKNNNISLNNIINKSNKCIFYLNSKQLNLQDYDNNDNCSIKDENLIIKLVHCLDKIINNNKIYCLDQSKLRFSPFELKNYPDISFYKYITNLYIYSKLNVSTLIYSFILIDRLLNTSKLILNDKNIFLLLFFSLRISIKVNEDYMLDDDSYCFLGKVKKQFYIINENYFLEAINYNIHVNIIEYNVYRKLLDIN